MPTIQLRATPRAAREMEGSTRVNKDTSARKNIKPQVNASLALARGLQSFEDKFIRTISESYDAEIEQHDADYNQTVEDIRARIAELQHRIDTEVDEKSKKANSLEAAKDETIAEMRSRFRRSPAEFINEYYGKTRTVEPPTILTPPLESAEHQAQTGSTVETEAVEHTETVREPARSLTGYRSAKVPPACLGLPNRPDFTPAHFKAQR